MRRRVVIGSVLALVVLVTLIGVLVWGGNASEELAVGGVEQEAGINEAPDTTAAPEALSALDTLLETTNEAKPEENTDSNSDDADADYDLPDNPVDDGGGSAVTDFRNPVSCDTAWTPSPEIIGDPSDPTYELDFEIDANTIITSILSRALSFEEMVECSDVIIVGEVGEIVATEYPTWDIPQEAELTEGEQSIPNSDQVFLDNYRTVFLQIEVQETLKGSPDTPFILYRSDTSPYGVLDPGSRILLFAFPEPNPHFLTSQVQNFYSTFPFVYGLYVLADSDRAYKFDDFIGDEIEAGPVPIPPEPVPIPPIPPILESEKNVYHQDESGKYYLDLGELRAQIIPSLISLEPHLPHSNPELARDSAETLPSNERYNPPNITEKLAVGEGSRCAIDISYTLEEMLEFSDVIIVGEVRGPVATEFRQPFIEQEQEGGHLTEAEIAALFAELIEIEVLETLKGEPVNPFVFVSDDSFHDPWPFFHPQLTAGDRLLLFAEGRSVTSPIPYYVTFAFYNGIYVLDGEDRAYQLAGDCFANDYEAWEPNYEPIITPPILESDKKFYHQDQDGGFYLDIENLRERIIPGFEGLP